MDKNKRKLEEIFNYSVEHNSYNKSTMIDDAVNVCVFGLGAFFKEAFDSKHIKENYHVTVLSDNCSDYWGKKINDIPVVSPEKLKYIENLVVIILIGNPLPIEKQLDVMGISWVTYTDLTIDDELGFTKNLEEYECQKQELIDTVDLLADDKSREIYVECLANRMAYPLATLSFDDMCTKKEYFGLDILPLRKDEIYVDCGAYNGDTIDRFIDSVGGNISIYMVLN